MREKWYTLPEKLRRQYGTCDPFRLAELLGIQVRFLDLKRQKGFCKRILKQNYIFLNQNMSREMQRMTAAHELGHLLLHQDVLSAEVCLMHMELFDMRSSTEYEANLFAAGLLIDGEELMEHLRNGEDLAAAASALGVNVNLVALRLIGMREAGLPVACDFTPDRRFLGRIEDRPDAR